jgi:hypothetical protein
VQSFPDMYVSVVLASRTVDPAGGS